jgi:DNA-binding transcriptional ArsR family regulator
MSEEKADRAIELTPASLKALSHPLRIGMLGLLRVDGPATSSGLARRLGTNSGATSYHLRQLERHGFVEEDPHLGTARQRFWRATHDYSVLDRSRMLKDADAVVLLDEFMRLGSKLRESEVAEWIESQDEWGPEWTDASASDDFFLRLNRRELAELVEGIRSLVHQMVSRPRPDGPEDAEAVRMHLVAFPISDPSSALLDAVKEAKP